MALDFRYIGRGKALDRHHLLRVLFPLNWGLAYRLVAEFRGDARHPRTQKFSPLPSLACSLAPRVDTAAPCGLLPTLDGPIHSDQFTGNPQRLLLEKGGDGISLSWRSRAPLAQSPLGKSATALGGGAGGEAQLLLAAFRPLRLTSRTFPNA